MRKLLLLATLLAQPVQARHFTSAARGTSSEKFLTLGMGARAAALGEAYSAMADGADAIYWNPAALTRTARRSATFMHASYIDDSVLEHAAYSQSLKDWGALGFGVQYFSAGGINATDAAGADIGRLTPYDLAVSLGYAYRLHGYSLGLTGKFIQSRIVHTAETGAVDLGVLTPAYLGGRVSLAATATNLGGKVKFDQVSEELPMAFRLGSRVKILDDMINERWTASLDLGFPRADNPFAALGTEYWFITGNAWRLAGRAGFNSRTLGSIDGFTGLSFGIGLGYNGGSVDYGFVPFGGLGQAHRLSLSYNF